MAGGPSMDDRAVKFKTVRAVSIEVTPSLVKVLVESSEEWGADLFFFSNHYRFLQ
jgi:hypothetical protein